MALPKYHLTKEILKEQIINGKFKINGRFLSVQEIIQEHKVSRATAFRILNELSKEGFVLIKNGIGTFVRDFASETKLPENNILFITFAKDFTTPFHSNILNGAKKYFSKSDYNMLYEWISVNSKDNRPNKKEFNILKAKLLWMKKNNRVLGIIFAGAVSRNTITALKDIGIPYVLAGDLSEPEIATDLDVIGYDSFHYGYKAVKYLTNLNHKRIGCIMDNTNYSWINERLRGYKSALKDAGCRIDEELIIRAAKDNPAEGYSALVKLMKLKQRPTAVFCFDDRLIIGVMNAVIDLGIKISEDLSIISISSSDTTKDYYPKLTFIRYLPNKVGETAVKTLLDKIKNRANHKEHKVTIEAEFVKGSSCKII